MTKSQNKKLNFKKYLYSQKSKKFITYAIATSLISLIMFVIVTLGVRSDMTRSLDFDLTVRLQDKTPLKLDDFFSILSIIGRFEYTFTLLLILLLINRKLIGIIAGIGAFGLAHIIEVIGKTTLNQPGPPHMFLRTHFTDFPGLYVHTQASYPSGHSLRIIFLLILLTYIIWRTKKIPKIAKYAVFASSTAITLAMLYSRVSLGEHWTTDVIGGTFLGASAALATLVFL